MGGSYEAFFFGGRQIPFLINAPKVYAGSVSEAPSFIPNLRDSKDKRKRGGARSGRDVYTLLPFINPPLCESGFFLSGPKVGAS